MSAGSGSDAEGVLVVAPTTADAELTRSILAEVGLGCHVCRDLPSLAAQIEAGAGVVLLTDDVLASGDQRSLREALGLQASWSDIPVILLSAAGADAGAAAHLLGGIANVTVLERPVRIATLVSALRSAVRARRRQYELRDQLAALQRTEGSLRKQTERLRLLWRSASLMLAADEPRAAMGVLFERIAPHFGLDAYAHYRLDDAGGLRLVACAGIDEARAGAITHADAADDPVARLAAHHGMRAYASCPLVVGGRSTGTLSFASRDRSGFDADELEFLRTIAHYVAVANERSRLFAELRDSDRRKDEFLATLAHELRNPLAPIGNAIGIMEMSRDDRDAVERARRMIERQLGHMVRLIDDLLDVSRITRGKLALRRERVDVAAVVRNSLDTAGPVIEAAGHEVDVALPPEPIYVHADPVRLAQVLSNLLNNAAKYMDRGGRIVLRVGRDRDGVAIAVRDSGIGIPAEALSSVFEMFTQIDASLEKAQGGLGIGLTLVKSLVEMHGGRVAAHSDGVGRGSEFVVHLPVVDAPPSERPAGDEARNRAEAPACRVLVADDNSDAAESLSTLLQLMGNEVRTVHDGLAAVEEAAAFRPDVVLLDIGMPKLDGYEAARRIRRERWGAPMQLVALTGWGQDEDRRRATEAGFDRHFTKPVSPSTVRELLASLRGSGMPSAVVAPRTDRR